MRDGWRRSGVQSRHGSSARADRRTPVSESRSRRLVDAVLGVTKADSAKRGEQGGNPGAFRGIPGHLSDVTIAAKLGPVRAHRRALRRKWTG